MLSLMESPPESKPLNWLAKKYVSYNLMNVPARGMFNNILRCLKGHNLLNQNCLSKKRKGAMRAR